MTDPEICHYCEAVATTRDHIVPLSRHGLTRLWNLVPACQPCNGRKGSAMPKCPCDRCRLAVSRWRKGARSRYTPAERRALQARSQALPDPVPPKAEAPKVPRSAPVSDPLPPELACLSPAMAALLWTRRKGP